MNEDTPRTNLVTFDIEVVGDAYTNRLPYPDGMGDLVDADFARQLERDLHAANRELAEARAEGERVSKSADAICRDFMALLMDEPRQNGSWPHLIICNGSHRVRIGDHDDEICNCPLGKRIKQLRASRDEAVKALEEARDAFPCGFYYDESLPSRIRIMRKQWDSTQQELSRLNQWILSQPDLQARWQKAANEHE